MNVLLVEDNRKLARALAEMLEEDGHSVAIAYDGERGLELGLQSAHEVIVLDVMLPRIDGFEVCRTLRANRVETPVLMLTARTAVDDRVQGLDAGADDYLPKPFAFAEFMARLRALNRRQIDPRDPDRLELDGLSLDIRRRRAERGGRTVELTPTEFALLEMLIRNRGRVLSREQILDHVWGYESWPESNLVPVYITYLRRKFEKMKVKAEIRSVRGVGYVLED